MFIEFPKALYLHGNPEAESVIVQDKDQEAAKRAEGFCSVGEEATVAPAKRGPGRPRKEATE